MSSPSKRLLNLCLRGTTLVSKFALVFVLAKFLEPAEVGLYGLVAATVAFCLFALGLEFYTYSMRELIATPASARQDILYNQLAFYCLTYILFLPAFIALFSGGLLPWEVISWFYILLILEHAAQELNRILVGLSLQLEASLVLFVRSGAWGLVLIPFMWSTPSLRSLNAVLAAWSIGSAAACVLGNIWIARRIQLRNFSAIDWKWIKNGARVALPMLVAAFAIRGLFTFDRYWIEALSGLETLGAYVLYAGIGTAVISFLDAGVVVFFYPRLVNAARSNNTHEFKSAMKSLGLNITLATIILTALAFGASFLVIEWLNRPAYTENFHLLKWLLLAMFIYGMSHTPHLGLYAQGRDRTLITSQTASLLTFLITAAGLNGSLGTTAVPVALCAAFSVLLLWKTVVYKRMIYELNASI